MTLSSQNKAEIRNRLQFYREMGIGPLYRRVSASTSDSTAKAELTEVEASEIVESALESQAESSVPSKRKRQVPSDDRDSLLRIILDEIGPSCTLCKLSRLGRKQIVF